MISNFIRGGGEVKFGKWWCPFKLRMIEEMAEWGVKKPGKRCLQALVDRKQRLPKFWIQSYFSFSWFMMSMHKNIYILQKFVHFKIELRNFQLCQYYISWLCSDDSWCYFENDYSDLPNNYASNLVIFLEKTHT